MEKPDLRKVTKGQIVVSGQLKSIITLTRRVGSKRESVEVTIEKILEMFPWFLYEDKIFTHPTIDPKEEGK